MTVKIATTAAAAVMLLTGAAAQADTLYAPTVSGSSFTDLVVGSIEITSLSNLVGKLFAADSINVTFGGNTYTLALDQVSFVSTTLGTLADEDSSASGFSFSNLAAGTYELVVSGTLDGSGVYSGTAFIGAEYTVSGVTQLSTAPEPESYAMMLAGLAAVGMLARRRRSG